jgi:hypothetical protein
VIQLLMTTDHTKIMDSPKQALRFEEPVSRHSVSV